MEGVVVLCTSRRAGLAAALGGGIAALAFPPFTFAFLAPVGVGLLAWSLGDASLRRAAFCGALYGLVSLGVTLWWLAEAIAPLAWLAVVVVQAGWLAVVAVLMRLVRSLPWWPLWTACLFSVGESVRSATPWGGVPWGRLGYAVADSPWAALLPVAGVAVAGTVVALAGTLLAASATARDAGTRPRWRPAVSAMLLLLLPALSGALVSAGEADKTFAAVVGLVQATVPGDGTDVAANHRLVTDSLAAETRTLVQGMDGASLDLVLWPENATAVDPADDPIAAGALEAAVDMADAPLLAGAVVDGPTAGTALNQSLLWTATGEVVGRYTKQRLVPFGEYVPLRPLAERLSNRVQAIRRDMVPGPAPSPLPVGPMRLATALCFDIAYDDVVRDQVAEGANLVAVQTSNAMFLGTAQPEQQWQVSRARALEVGRAIVVSSVNGVSGAVMPDGRVLTRLPERIAGSDVVRVPLSHELTWATRVGAWPIRTVWFVGLMALLVAVVSRLRTDHPATAVSPSPDSPVLP